ncbi:Cytokinin glycosidase [Parasponia andersonii]|uniref:Cytokinin glycosidase n=1 Tax=Parasponia andersonii TaxID=3476 RepID=A0A2P5CZQ3_PARAD|nr:Cytokinin glycosidase [Parasponia andersonii]
MFAFFLCLHDLRIFLCLHDPLQGKLELLVVRLSGTLWFSFVSGKLLDEFLNEQRITPLCGGVALACMISPHINDISLQEMVCAHDRIWLGRYKSKKDNA